MRKLGSQLWRWLGGRLGDDGEPELWPTDLVIVFSGPPLPASRALDVVRKAGIVARGDAQAKNGLAGTSAFPPRCRVLVASEDAERARELINSALVYNDRPPPDPPPQV